MNTAVEKMLKIVELPYRVNGLCGCTHYIVLVGERVMNLFIDPVRHLAFVITSLGKVNSNQIDFEQWRKVRERVETECEYGELRWNDRSMCVYMSNRNGWFCYPHKEIADGIGVIFDVFFGVQEEAEIVRHMIEKLQEKE